MIAGVEVNVAALDLLSADPGTLAPATLPNKVHLVIAPFTPSPNVLLADLEVATFAGSTPKAGIAGPQQVGYNSSDGGRFIQLIPPVGGWYWEATAAPAEMETVHGFIVTDDTGAVTIGCDLLPSPQFVGDMGDSVLIPVLRLNAPLSIFS